MTTPRRISDLLFDDAHLIAVRIEHAEVFGGDGNPAPTAGARFFFDSGAEIYVADPDIETKLAYSGTDTVPSGATQITS